MVGVKTSSSPNQPINQSTNQSINQSINRSQSIQAANQSINQLFNGRIIQASNQSTNQCLREWDIFSIETQSNVCVPSCCRYCLMLLDNLGKDYIVWDKAAVIRFKSPGMGTITAKCRLTEEVIERVREEADRDGRCQPTFLVEIFDSNGKVVAEIDKMISVRRKDRSKSRTPAVNSEKGRTDWNLIS